MERLAQLFREYGDTDLLAAAVAGIDPVETVEELEDILEAELSYMGE